MVKDMGSENYFFKMEEYIKGILSMIKEKEKED